MSLLKASCDSRHKTERPPGGLSWVSPASPLLGSLPSAKPERARCEPEWHRDPGARTQAERAPPVGGRARPPSTRQAHGRKQEAVSGGVRGRGTAAPAQPRLCVPAEPPFVPHRQLPEGTRSSARLTLGVNLAETVCFSHVQGPELT